MPLTPAQKQANYRKRQRMAAAEATRLSAEAIKERDEANEKLEQLSRSGGVPRNYPLSVWRRAANAFIVGEGRAQEKVKLLRSMCAGDKEMRKKVAEWVKTDQSEAAKKYVAAQGWTLATGSETRTQSIVDEMVAALEAGKKLEDHFTAEELNSPAPADPEHDAAWANYQHYLKTGHFLGKEVTHKCNQCGGPYTKAIPRGDGHSTYWCDRHCPTDTRPTRRPASRLCGYPGCTEAALLDYDHEKRCFKHKDTFPATATSAPAVYAPSVPPNRAPYPSDSAVISSHDPAFLKLPPQAQASIVQREALESGHVIPNGVGMVTGRADFTAQHDDPYAVFINRKD